MKGGYHMRTFIYNIRWSVFNIKRELKLWFYYLPDYIHFRYFEYED